MSNYVEEVEYLECEHKELLQAITHISKEELGEDELKEFNLKFKNNLNSLKKMGGISFPALEKISAVLGYSLTFKFEKKDG